MTTKKTFFCVKNPRAGLPLFFRSSHLENDGSEINSVIFIVMVIFIVIIVSFHN
jgi:hypothetical protein